MKSVTTYAIKVFMAGDIETAKRWLRRYCYSTGCCFTVTPTTFIYTGGEETGFVVGLVNYPRFPMTPDDLDRRASRLAEELMLECCQRTALIVAPEQTRWIEIKPPGAPA